VPSAPAVAPVVARPARRAARRGRFERLLRLDGRRRTARRARYNGVVELLCQKAPWLCRRGIVLFLLYSAASSLLRGRREIPAAIVPLASFALVALAAYGVFWVFFASALAGKVLVWALLAGSAWIFAGTCAVPSTSCDPEHRIPVLLMAATAACTWDCCCSTVPTGTMSDIASRRFINNLAVDNELPQMFADRLIHGEDPRHLAFGWWLSSDRPPLQTGTDLLIAYPVAAAERPRYGRPSRRASGCSLSGYARPGMASDTGNVHRASASGVIALIAPTGS